MWVVAATPDWNVAFAALIAERIALSPEIRAAVSVSTRPPSAVSAARAVLASLDRLDVNVLSAARAVLASVLRFVVSVVTAALRADASSATIPSAYAFASFLAFVDFVVASADAVARAAVTAAARSLISVARPAAFVSA